MSKEQKYLLGVYSDEEELIQGVRQIKDAGIKIEEVYSPFPVHGLEKALGYKRSRLPIAAFLFGAIGAILALSMQYWMMGIDWQLIIGGKDYASWPPFIPVTFELTVLLAALGMVGVFMVASNLKPHKKPRIYDVRITDDKHVVVINLKHNDLLTEQKIENEMKSANAEEVNVKSFTS